jgi:hypothetical protein
VSEHVLSKAQFFHGSDTVFTEGDMITAPAERGQGPRFSMSDPSRVYVTTHPKVAKKFGRHIYEVEPQGEIGDDPFSPLRKTAPTAKVIGKLPR